MSTEESSHPEESTALVLAHRGPLTLELPNLEIAGVKVTSLEEAWNAIENLPEEDKVASITKFNKELLRYKGNSDDLLLRWGELVNAGLQGSPPLAYKVENTEFTATVKDLRKAKDGKDDAKKALQTALEHPERSGRRADAFIEFLQEDFNDAGKSAYGNLKRLFTKASSVRQAIRVLNMCTLRRNRKFKYTYSKSALTHIDIVEALKCINQAIEELKAEDLKTTGLKFGPSGILIEGQYNEEPFPGFPDEGEQAPVTITSVAEGQSKDQQEGEKDPALEDLLEPKQYPEGLDKDAQAKRNDSPAKDPESAVTPEETSTPLETPLRRSKRKAQEVEEQEEAESPTPAAKKVTESPAKKPKTTPKPAAKATPTPTLEVAPVPTPKVVKTPRKPRGKENDCDGVCGMTKEWYMDVGIWEELSFKEKKWVLKDVADNIIHQSFKNKRPCNKHLKEISDLLLLKTVDDPDEILRQVTAIYQAVERRNSIHRAWVHVKTKSLFRDDPKILQYREQVTIADRFHPAPVPELSPSPLPKRDLEQAIVEIQEGFWEWIEEKGLKDMLVTEIEMLRFHCRQDKARRNGELPNSYFTLAAQLLWADPMTWMLFHTQMPSKNGFLVAYPQPIRYYEKGSIEVMFYEGDAENSGGNGLICSETVLHGRDLNWGYFVPRNISKAREVMVDILGDPKFIDLDREESIRGLIMSSLPQGEDDDPFLGVKVKEKQYDMILYKSRTFHESIFELKEHWISIPVSLVPIGEDNMAANGVSYWDINASHNERKAPAVGRFKSTEDDVSFRGSIGLEDLGVFFDMARCVKRPDNDPRLRRTMEEWLSADAQTAKKLYDDWKDKAVRAVTEAFEELKNQEMAMFEGNKSFFRSVMSQQVLEEDDPDYLSISDEQEAME